MSSTVVNRLVVIASFAMALGWTSTAVAGKAETEAAVVARLYKDFAWQAIASQPDLFGEDLAHQSKATLEKYFAPALAELLVQDAVCQARSQGICNLDFELLFDSQDPRVTDLDVETLAPGKVSVVFKDPINEEKTKIEFNLAQVAGKWKIADIIYRKNGEPSLKKVLSRRTP
jgi:hypothetical protein